MKKDVLASVIIGFILGSVSAVAMVKLPDLLNQKSTENSNPATINISPFPTQTVYTIQRLTVTNLPDFSILNEKTASISGETNPGSQLVAETSAETVVQRTNDSGNFSVKLNLSEGANPIYLTSYNDQMEAKTVTLTLFYTGEKL